MNDLWKQKLKWEIYNKNLDELYSFQYSCFKFKFNIKPQKQQEQFADFICDTEDLMPYDICNYFIKNHIKYSIHFRYIKKIGLKGNLKLLKLVLWLKKEKLKIYYQYWKDNHILQLKKENKLINGKYRNDYMVIYTNKIRKRFWFIQFDSNVWWKFKRLTNKFDNGKGVSIGWLFCQVGKIQWIKEE